jgi:hypothetical protein
MEIKASKIWGNLDGIGIGVFFGGLIRMYNIIHGINNIPQRDDKDVITSRILLFYFFGNVIYCV